MFGRAAKWGLDNGDTPGAYTISDIGIRRLECVHCGKREGYLRGVDRGGRIFLQCKKPDLAQCRKRAARRWRRRMLIENPIINAYQIWMIGALGAILLGRKMRRLLILT